MRVSIGSTLTGRVWTLTCLLLCQGYYAAALGMATGCRKQNDKDARLLVGGRKGRYCRLSCRSVSMLVQQQASREVKFHDVGHNAEAPGPIGSVATSQ